MPSLPELELQRLNPSNEIAFSTLIDLYEQSFPESERKPIATLRRMLAAESCYFLLATQDGSTIGFAIAHVLSDNSAAIVEYMAIAPKHRNRGLGRQLFLTIAKALNAPPRALLLELESDQTESPDLALRTRRKYFYRSLGARELNGLHWIMPPVIAIPPPAMEMLVFPAPAISVSKSQLRQWLTSIYVEVYEQSAEDPRIATMLHSLPNEISLL